jgi:hypothetical protein
MSTGWDRQFLLGLVEHVAEPKRPGRRRKRRRRANHEDVGVGAADQSADPFGILGQDRSGAGADQDADGAARTPPPRS